MSAPLFDRYLVVDWSAASVPKTGADSIWCALIARDGDSDGVELIALENPATRAAAMAQITDILRGEVAAGRRVLAGFDFPFGYPAGVARRLCGRADWAALWGRLSELFPETANNSNDRFRTAGAMNEAWQGEGPFWGNGSATEHAGLPRKKPKGWGETLPPEWRLIETRQRAHPGANPKSVWQLAGAGSVGSQVLTGIASLERLRNTPGLAEHCQVWPFETGLAVPMKPICIAEVYPSLVPIRPETGEVKDALQVEASARRFAELDKVGSLAPLFAGSTGLTAKERQSIETEEAWILGAEGMIEMKTQPPARALRYQRDPQAIYAESFATVRREARLDHLPDDLAEVAIRLIHASGMVETSDRLAWSADVVSAGRQALQTGAPVLCDCEMVASGVIRRALPAENEVISTINDPRTPDLSKEIGNTRSAAAVELWHERIGGAVVAIGNAPTALFHLLELLDQGWPKPAAILGFPVGFVGAAESKAELAARPRGVPFLTLRGRRGGSALASAAVNALCLGLAGDGR